MNANLKKKEIFLLDRHKNKLLMFLVFLIFILFSPSVFAAGINIPSGSILNLNSATLSLPGSLTIGGTLVMSSGKINLSGDWNNQGTFTAGTGTVFLAGARGSTQNILGESRFYNLSCATAGVILKFEAGKEQAVLPGGLITLKGTSKDDPLYLRSSIDGSSWLFDPLSQANITISAVDVKDSTNKQNFYIDPPDSQDSGNNIRWFTSTTVNGTITLFISRENNNIKISWDPSGLSSPPDIYLITGDGSGAYTNTTNLWVAITDTSVSADFDITNMPNGYIIHKDQVGAGTSEAYYKGLTSGSEKETTLPTAQAVGKFNLQLQLGLNNLSANPLIPSNLGIDSVIGTQLPNGTVLSTRDPSGIWHQPVYVSATQSWSSNIELKTDYGFWINIPSGTPTITIVGNVADSERTIPLYSGLNNLLGSTYPIQADLNSSKLGDALGTSGGKLSAYSDGRWREPVYVNGAWSSLDYKLQPGKGFWVNRYESGGIIEWKYPKLY